MMISTPENEQAVQIVHVWTLSFVISTIVETLKELMNCEGCKATFKNNIHIFKPYMPNIIDAFYQNYYERNEKEWLH